MNELLGNLLSGIIPAVLVGIISVIFNYKQQHALEKVRAVLTARSGFFMRKIEAHEKVWPLVAQCQRAQESLSRGMAKGGTDPAPLAGGIGEARRALKNFVYDNGLYFDEEVRQLVQDLDTRLADPKVTDVREAVRHLEAKLRSVIDDLA